MYLFVLMALVLEGTQVQTGRMRSNILSQLLRKRCTELNLRQSDVAERAGMTRAYLYRLCSGRTPNPGIRTLQRLAVALEVPSAVVYRAFEPTRRGSGNVVDHSGLEPRLGGHGGTDVWRFVSDVTIPDHSVVSPGERFVKTWAVQNAGEVTWADRRLTRADEELAVYPRRALTGDRTPWLPAIQDIHLASLGTHQEIPTTRPGEVVELSVEFAAPMEACSVASIWRPTNAQGQPLYGARCFLQAVVTVLC